MGIGQAYAMALRPPAQSVPYGFANNAHLLLPVILENRTGDDACGKRVAAYEKIDSARHFPGDFPHEVAGEGDVAADVEAKIDDEIFAGVRLQCRQRLLCERMNAVTAEIAIDAELDVPSIERGKLQEPERVVSVFEVKRLGLRINRRPPTAGGFIRRELA